MLKAPLDFKEASTAACLQNVQANILKHHGRAQAYYVFLRFREGKADKLKAWISEYTRTEITSAFKQLDDVERHKQAKSEGGYYDGGTVTCFFLAAKGYGKLGLAGKMPASYGTNSAGTNAFREGLKRRGPALLKDPVVSKWQQEFQQEIHALILLADDSPVALEGAAEKIRMVAGEDGEALLKIIHIQKGEIFRPAGIGLEHFGYADGISQPRFLKEEVPAGKVWNDNESDISTLLVKEDVPGAGTCYGSYMVFRKLEQNVKGFKEMEEALGKKLFPNLPKEEAGKAEIAGAYVVGRFEDGSPVTKFREEQQNESEDMIENDFNYEKDKEGSRCPYHAHIRLTNPRDRSLKEFARITRRGIPYDEAGRNGNINWHPEGGVGLLFMCYQASIEKQFEVIQGRWANNGNVFPGEKTGIDAIIGQGNNDHPQWYPLNYDTGDRVKMKETFKGFVKMLGGEYFYAPSIPFLTGLDKRQPGKLEGLAEGPVIITQKEEPGAVAQLPSLSAQDALPVDLPSAAPEFARLNGRQEQ